MSDFDKDTIHLIRLALEGKQSDVAAISRRMLRALSSRRPDLSALAKRVMETAAGDATQSAARPLPVDLDSRFELIRRDATPDLPIEPTWPSSVRKQLDAVLKEREKEAELEDAGIAPTRSLLFVGPPGVGKTLAAKWLAAQAKRELLTLDLASVMSSFLGRTGNNLRVVLDFARRTPSVLLLDEFDSIAKRRDDSTEVADLKRLVTVLPQAVDDWPSSGILIAATNHPSVVDPAVWRRFERVVEFPNPTTEEIVAVASSLMGSADGVEDRIGALAKLLDGCSFAEVVRVVNEARRTAIVDGVPVSVAMGQTVLAMSSCVIEKTRASASQRRSKRTSRDDTWDLRRLDTYRKGLYVANPGRM
jgi:ATP-dependent 26S proteasome regulatory subunit